MIQNRKTKWTFRVALTISAALICASAWYLFRTVKIDNPALGIFKYHYRWGRVATGELDVNRDGQPEVKEIYNRDSYPLKEGGLPREYWEDRDSDGIFEIHVVMSSDDIDYMEIDDDQDGNYDRRLNRASAKAYYRKLAPAQKNREPAEER